MTSKRLSVMVAGIVAVYLAAMVGLGTAHATAEPRYDTFRSRLSGNVVKIPARCWAEDSMAHLYIRDIRDHGATYVYGCHHRGY